ncbi:MAG: class I SAM-dependent methyltransferase [Planctomycetota bacterium]
MPGRREQDPGYLEPYREAVRRHGPSFEALLWRNEEFQHARFAVLAEVARPGGRVVADLGCGRGDMLPALESSGHAPARYVGVEGIEELLAACRERYAKHETARWLAGDFVRDRTLFETLVREHDASVIVFSGSLNTLDQRTALAVLDRAWDALHARPGGTLAFNFLTSAGRRRREALGPANRFRSGELFRWAQRASGRMLYRQDYLGPHDATIAVYAQQPEPKA